MHLTIAEAATILRTSQDQLYRWVDAGELPCFWVGDQPHFNRADLLEWATARRMSVAVHQFQDDDEAPLSLADALARGGIHYDVGGTDRASVLRAVVSLMRLPEEIEPETLVEIMLAREATGSTAIGDGIAIPHVRQPIAVNGGPPSVCLCFLATPVDYMAADHKPVHIIFSIVSPTVRGHLQLLARLAAALHDDAFRTAVLHRASMEALLSEARRVETRSAPPEPRP